MNIELSKQARVDAVASLKRYFDENMNEPLGDLAAGLLLNYVIEEIGPAIYNQAVADASAKVSLRAQDLSGEMYIDEFQYWPRVEKKRRAKK